MAELEEIEITKRIECRVGRDHATHELFINELHSLDTGIADAIAEKLGIEPEELHSLTAGLIDLRQYSKYGGGHHGLTKLVLSLEISVKVKNYELIDDEAITKKGSE